LNSWPFDNDFQAARDPAQSQWRDRSAEHRPGPARELKSQQAGTVLGAPNAGMDRQPGIWRWAR